RAILPDAPRRSGVPKSRQLTEESAKNLIDGLKGRISKGEQIERELGTYPVKPDLQMVARVLGMTNAKLPPKDELIARISTRLRQSVSLTSGIEQRSLAAREQR
ncbi:MAG: hypothetical protein KGO48_10865, partial [Alphaproteobacteria bacterium]|nr:hypothetical protein [Alphaproteobacteria bacterium]